MDVFDRYAPFVQDFIYEHGWESLRGVQVAAAEAIFNTDENVLLTASTASGKTEAAFFPILTEFWENPPSTVGAYSTDHISNPQKRCAVSFHRSHS